MLIINNPTILFVTNNKYLFLSHLIQYGTISVKQNSFAHVSFINEQPDCDIACMLPLTTSRIANHYEEGEAT